VGCTGTMPRCIGDETEDGGDKIPNTANQKFGDRCIAPFTTCTNSAKDNELDAGCTPEMPRCTGGETGDDGSVLPNNSTMKNGNQCIEAVKCNNTANDNMEDMCCTNNMPRCIGDGTAQTTADEGNILPNEHDEKPGIKCIAEVPCKNDAVNNLNDTSCSNERPRCIGDGKDDGAGPYFGVDPDDLSTPINSTLGGMGDNCIKPVILCLDTLNESGHTLITNFTTPDYRCTVDKPLCTGSNIVGYGEGWYATGNECKEP